MALQLAATLEHLDVDFTNVFALLALISSYIIWRLWSFTLKPFLRPEEPPEYPYLIPYVGHVYGFFSDSQKLIDSARHYFRAKSTTFSITTLGEKTYIITTSEDVSAAYKNTESLSFTVFVQQLMRWSGSSEACIQAMFREPSAQDARRTAGFPNPHDKSLGLLSRDLHKHQLLPGEELQNLLTSVIEGFKHDLEPAVIASYAPTYSTFSSHDSVMVVPLCEWVSKVFCKASQQAFFGKTLEDINPDMVNDFLAFDDFSWQVLYQYPRCLSRRMHAARDRLKDALEVYFTKPLSERQDAAWFVHVEEAEMRRIGIDTHEVANMMAILYWAINTNMPKACFWLLIHLLQSPSLVSTIRAETLPALTPNGIDIDHLITSCPYLAATWEETMRVSSFSGSIRFVTTETMLGGKKLRPGNRLLIAYRLLHFDPNVFGPNVHDFNPERFVEDKTRSKNAKFRPFGGGSTMCPGRFVAQRAVLVFVALLIHRFDVSVPEGQKVPERDLKRPSLGLASRTEGTPDWYVRLTPRT